MKRAAIIALFAFVLVTLSSCSLEAEIGEVHLEGETIVFYPVIRLWHFLFSEFTIDFWQEVTSVGNGLPEIWHYVLIAISCLFGGIFYAIVILAGLIGLALSGLLGLIAYGILHLLPI